MGFAAWAQAHPAKLDILLVWGELRMCQTRKVCPMLPPSICSCSLLICTNQYSSGEVQSTAGAISAHVDRPCECELHAIQFARYNKLGEKHETRPLKPPYSLEGSTKSS
eukprot:6204775-Pleurochrysis_carterae.AAC.3